MRCQYCFYRDEQQNRVNPEDCMMTRATAETLIQRCFVEIEQGGFVSFAFQGGGANPGRAGFFPLLYADGAKVQPEARHRTVRHPDKRPCHYRGMG